MKAQVVLVGVLLALTISCGLTGGSSPAASSLNSGNPNASTGSAELSGNWQFSATSSVVAGSSGLVGYLTQNGNQFSGTLHVYGTNCFDYFTNVGVTGTVNGQQTQFSTASVSGQVVTVNASVSGNTGDTLNGTYTVTGGCGNGDTGTFAGHRIPVLAGQWTGKLTASDNTSINLQVGLAQGAPDATFGAATLSGTVTGSNSPCFTSGPISVGHIAGTSLSAIATTDNGTLYLSGHTDLSGTSLAGTYNIDGGSCAGQSGTLILTSSQAGQ